MMLLSLVFWSMTHQQNKNINLLQLLHAIDICGFLFVLTNITVSIRQQCRKNNSLKLPQMSNYHWCEKNEQHLNKDYIFDH